MKKLMCVVAAFVMAVGMISVSAQAAGKAGKDAKDGQGKGSPKQVIEVLQNAVAQLNLTDDQKSKINGFLDDARSKIKEIRANDKGDKQKAREDMLALRQNTRDSVMSVLTADQKTQLKDLLKEARADRRGKNADGPATAPATQPAA